MADFSAYKFYRGEESNPFRRGTLRHGIWEWEKRCEEIFTREDEPNAPYCHDAVYSWWLYAKDELKDEEWYNKNILPNFDGRSCSNKKAIVKAYMDMVFPKSHIPYLKQTRLYNGEPEGVNPYEHTPLEQLFFYEGCWVKFHFNDNGEYIKSLEREYLHDVNADFEANDGVPMSFKALLYNRYMHWCCGPVECFKDWYVNSIYHRRNYIKWKKEQNQIGD